MFRLFSNRRSRHRKAQMKFFSNKKNIKFGEFATRVSKTHYGKGQYRGLPY